MDRQMKIYPKLQATNVFAQASRLTKLLRVFCFNIALLWLLLAIAL
jgi:hypothetical protein